MRAVRILIGVVAIPALLSGCAAAELAGDAVGAGATVATTTVDVATGVVGTAAGTITGGSKDDKRPD